MLPERHWWRGNPHYDCLWQVTTARQRLQREVLQALLERLPEEAGRALIDELMAARKIGQVQALRTDTLTQGLIDAVLDAVVERAITYRLRDDEVRMIPVSKLRELAAPDWRMSEHQWS